MAKVPKIKTEPRRKHPEEPIWSKVNCVFPDGAIQSYFATHVSLGGAFILAMSPPTIGTTLMVTLFPHGMQPLPPIEALVIGLRVDPGDAERSGFEVVFTHLEDDHLNKLSFIVSSLEQVIQNVPRRLHGKNGEHRRMPRVHTNLLAILKTSTGTFISQVANLSLLGAMLEFHQECPATDIKIGEKVNVALKETIDEEGLCIQCQIVRFEPSAFPPNMAIKFIQLKENEKNMLEDLILTTMAKNH